MKKRLIAYYLPQFHEIKENNVWWEEGYTEWTALKKWKPYFNGHQLRMPTKELGYYDLSNHEVLEKQYEIASNYSLEGFCFWIYWFGAGDRLLEKPLEHLLLSNSKVKYCLAWANHSWRDRSASRLLKEQKYLGKQDYISFYKTMAAHFNNPNYIKKDNKLLLSIFAPQDIPDLEIFLGTLNNLAQKDGFDGFYFISDQSRAEIIKKNLFDGYMHSIAMFKNRNILQKIMERLIKHYGLSLLGPVRYSYKKMMSDIYAEFIDMPSFIPMIFTGWDTTPRHKNRGNVMKDFNVTTFKEHVDNIFSLKTNSDFIFIKSWNEWAEGNVLEPDSLFQDKLLKIIKENNTHI